MYIINEINTIYVIKYTYYYLHSDQLIDTYILLLKIIQKF